MKIFHLAISLLFLFSANANALKFSKLGGTFFMEGPIEVGDAERFEQEITSWPMAPTVFLIESPGGDLLSSIIIGQYIRTYQIPIWVQGICAGSCVNIYVAGVERRLYGLKSFLAIHRPTIKEAGLASANQIESEEKYPEKIRLSKAYLNQMGVDPEVINKIHSRSSDAPELLGYADVSDFFPNRIPFYDEFLAGKCGRNTDFDLGVIASYGSLDAVQTAIKNGTYDQLEQTIIKMAASAVANGQNQEWIDALVRVKALEDCEKKWANSYVIPFHNVYRAQHAKPKKAAKLEHRAKQKSL